MRKNIVALTFLVVGVIIFGAGFALFPSLQRQVDPFPEVAVSGTIRTKAGTVAIRLDFEGGSFLLPYSGGGALFSTPASGGTYSLALPNRASYTVTVTLSESTGATATCPGGVLELDVNASSITFDIECV